MAGKQILLSSLVVRKDKGLVSSKVGDETVMMDMESGKYIGLNNVGSDIWQMLETEVKVTDLVDRLTEQYDVDRSKCEAQTLAYLEKMKEQDMIIIVA